MLAERFSAETLQIVPLDEWTPYPTAADRAAWEALPGDLRATLIAQGEAALKIDWQPLLATRFLEYARIGNRSEYERENFGRRNKLIALALAECAEGQRALRRRDRQRHLADLRGDLLGLARARRHAAGGRRSAGCCRTDGRPVRRRDRRRARLHRLSARRRAGRRIAADPTAHRTPKSSGAS